MRREALLAALSAGLLASPAPAGERPDLLGSKYGERRAYFRDVLASCRPDGDCSALSYIGAAGDLFEGSVRFRRPPGDAPLELVLTPPFGSVGDDATLTLRVDGATVATLAPGAADGWTRGPNDAVNEFRVAQGAAAARIAEAARGGRWLTLTTGDAAAPAARWSLRGLRAAFGWIEAER